MHRANVYLKNGVGGAKIALRCFKLMLKYSWICNSIRHENNAYKGIAFCYYYLGIMDKSKSKSHNYSPSLLSTQTDYFSQANFTMTGMAEFECALGIRRDNLNPMTHI